MNFVTAKCPQCSGALQLPDDREVVKCMYCGVDVVVQQAIQFVSPNSKNFMELAKSAAAAANYSEAYAYYTRVLEIEPRNAEAWIGNGVAAGWLSNLRELRLGEMLTCFDNAIKFSQSDSAGDVRRGCALQLNQVAAGCYSMSQKHTLEFIKVPKIWGEHLQRCNEIISVYEIAHLYSPYERAILENIIAVCKGNIEGVKYRELIPGTTFQEPKLAALTPEYEQKLRGKIGVYARKIQELDPSYVPPNPQRETAGCFVVTATLGNDRHPQVQFLRSFRDELLLKSAGGAVLVAWYCRYGPALARRIENSKFARAMSYLFLVVPMVAVARVVTWAANPKATRVQR